MMYPPRGYNIPMLQRWIRRPLDAALARAQADPQAFIGRARERLVVIDEVQRAPALLLGIKAAVDRDRRPGRFLLTGSTHVRVVPRAADALVGRMEILP